MGGGPLVEGPPEREAPAAPRGPTGTEEAAAVRPAPPHDRAATPQPKSTSPSSSIEPVGHTARTMPAAASALRQPGHGWSVM